MPSSSFPTVSSTVKSVIFCERPDLAIAVCAERESYCLLHAKLRLILENKQYKFLSPTMQLRSYRVELEILLQASMCYKS